MVPAVLMEDIGAPILGPHGTGVRLRGRCFGRFGEASSQLAFAEQIACAFFPFACGIVRGVSVLIA